MNDLQKRQIEGLPWQGIKLYANKYAIPLVDVAALILTESNGNRYAARYEATCRCLRFPIKFANSTGITVETERTLQRTSFGLMQVMGFKARELDFQGPLVKLFEVASNLDVGCLLLSELRRRYNTPEKIIAAYNAGSPKLLKSGKYVNQPYVDRFISNQRLVTEYLDAQTKYTLTML